MDQNPDWAQMLKHLKMMEAAKALRGPQAPPQGPPAPTAPPPQAPVPMAPQSGPMGPPQAPPPGPGPMQGPPAPPPPPAQPNAFDQLGADGLEQVMSMGGLEEQMQTAQAMRDQDAPGGRYVSGGRVYTPGSLLEHGVSAFGKRKGRKDVKRIAGEQKAGRTSILDLLRGVQPEDEEEEVYGAGRVM